MLLGRKIVIMLVSGTGTDAPTSHTGEKRDVGGLRQD
jgi:hypothetical protein